MEDRRWLYVVFVLSILAILASLLVGCVSGSEAMPPGAGMPQGVSHDGLDGVPDRIVDPDTGKTTYAVFGGTSVLIIDVPPGGGPFDVELVDQWPFEHRLPYYTVNLLGDAADPPVTVTPVRDDGVVGPQSPVRTSTSPRGRWTKQDNIDNGDGKAFNSWRLTLRQRPRAGDPDVVVELVRRSKQFVDDPVPGQRWGRLRYDRDLQVRFRPVEPETFSDHLKRRSRIPVKPVKAVKEVQPDGQREGDKGRGGL